MAIDFPASPTNGQHFTSGGITWTWDGVKWTLGGSSPIFFGDSPPNSPAPGTLWWDTVSGNLFIWYVDASSSQWVICLNIGTTGPQGAQGIQGVKGDTGLTGPVGPMGPVPPNAIGENRVINGDMAVDQRWNGASQSTSGFVTDRWFCQYNIISGITSGRNLAGAAMGHPPGFPNSLGSQGTAAHAIAATEYYHFVQVIEADAVGDLGFGTADAQQITLSFWACSNVVSGTFGGSLRAGGGLRSYPFTYQLPVANVWTRIVLTIPGDTAGTWITSGNGQGMMLGFGLANGANFSGPPFAWSSNNYHSANGAISCVSVAYGGLWITGVKLEVGAIATPFPMQSMAKRLADCQRYYEAGYFNNSGAAGAGGCGLAYFHSFNTTKRAAPTVTISNPQVANVGSQTASNISPFGFTPFSISTAAGGYYWQGNYAANAEL